MPLSKNNIKDNAFLLKHFIQNINKEKFNNINKQPAHKMWVEWATLMIHFNN